MQCEIKNFDTEGDHKRVGFMCEENGKKFAIDKLITIVDGKSTESYIEDAYASAKDEIDAWAADAAANVVGKKWNPESNSIED